MDKNTLLTLLGQLTFDDLLKVGLHRGPPPSTINQAVANNAPEPVPATTIGASASPSLSTTGAPGATNSAAQSASSAAASSSSSAASAAATTSSSGKKKRQHGRVYYLDFHNLRAFESDADELNKFFYAHKKEIRSLWKSTIVEECPEGTDSTQISSKLEDIKGRFRSKLGDQLRTKPQTDLIRMYFDNAVREFSKEFSGQRFRNAIRVANKQSPDDYDPKIPATKERRSDGTFVASMNRRINTLSGAWKTNFLKAVRDQAAIRRTRKSRKRRTTTEGGHVEVSGDEQSSEDDREDDSA